MDHQSRQKLRENYVELVRNLNPEDVTDFLFQEHVLSEEDCENIQSGATRAQRMRIFLGVLPTKNRDGLAKFITAMKEAGYVELAELLEKPMSPEVVSIEEGQEHHASSFPFVEDERLMSLKERLEQQSIIVASMQAEMETLQEELKRQSQSFESNEKYKRTVTVLNELEKEKAEKQKVYDEIYEALLNDMNKEDEEQKAKPSSRTSTMRTPSFTVTGGIRHYAKIKCVLVGDGGTGKTSIIHYFINKTRLESYVPTIFDNHSVEIQLGNTMVTVNFWDTAGQDGYDKLRPLSYADSHVALLVFSVTSQTTLNNVLAKWHPEFKHYCRKVPYILVGNKTDPMNDQKKLYEIRQEGERFVEAREAHKAAEHMRASKKTAFLCSAHTGEGIHKLLESVAEVGLKRMLRVRRRKDPCLCM